MATKKVLFLMIMAVFVLALTGCNGVDEERDLLFGRWELSNLDEIMNDISAEIGADFSEFEEYMEIGMAVIFGSDDEFTMEISMYIDFQAMIEETVGNAIEIDADPIDFVVTVTGEYEIVSSGEMIIRVDNDSAEISVEEYCFRVAGIETCQNIVDMTGGFEDFSIFGDEEVSFYEVDGSSLTLWDEDCDYPDEQSCAALFSK